VREQAPLLATAFEDVEDGLEDLTKIVSSGASTGIGGGHVRLDVIPFGVGKICWVRFLIPARVVDHHPQTTFHTVSEEEFSEVRTPARVASVRLTTLFTDPHAPDGPGRLELATL